MDTLGARTDIGEIYLDDMVGFDVIQLIFPSADLYLYAIDRPALQV